MNASQMRVKRSLEKDVPGLGAKIKQAREADSRSLETISSLAQMSRVYWYDIEAEKIRGALPEETLRKIEQVLGVNFGVDFDD